MEIRLVNWEVNIVKKIGYMPQQQEIYDNFTGEEFLWYMAALKGLEKKYAKIR